MNRSYAKSTHLPVPQADHPHTPDIITTAEKLTQHPDQCINICLKSTVNPKISQNESNVNIFMVQCTRRAESYNWQLQTNRL